MNPEISNIRRHVGVAGQFSYTVTVQYPEESARRVEFVGSSYGGPVLMRTDTWEMFVNDPGRFGSDLNPDWIRRFFTISE